jgi:hypothetical protein
MMKLLTAAALPVLIAGDLLPDRGGAMPEPRCWTNTRTGEQVLHESHQIQPWTSSLVANCNPRRARAGE